MYTTDNKKIQLIYLLILVLGIQIYNENIFHLCTNETNDSEAYKELKGVMEANILYLSSRRPTP